MNINYQKNILNIPIINSNYAYTQPKYVASLYSSPKKNIGNFSFNYGMRHYYSAEIKSSSKINHNVHKPIYILNPYYAANPLINQKIYNTNSIYILSNQIHTNKNYSTNSINQQNFINQNIINKNNEPQIKVEKTIMYNINNNNNIINNINYLFIWFTYC